MSSTPRGMGRGYNGLYDVFSQSFLEVGLVGLLGKVWHTIVHIFYILAKEDQRFCSTCWDSCGFQFWWCVLSVIFKFLMFNVCHSLLLLLKLNEWVNEVESIDSSALLLNLFSFICFCQFGEDPYSPLPSSAPCPSDPCIHIFTSIKTTAYLAQTRILQRSGLIPKPKIAIPIFPTKTQKI